MSRSEVVALLRNADRVAERRDYFSADCSSRYENPKSALGPFVLGLLNRVGFIA